MKSVQVVCHVPRKRAHLSAVARAWVPLCFAGNIRLTYVGRLVDFTCGYSGGTRSESIMVSVRPWSNLQHSRNQNDGSLFMSQYNLILLIRCIP